VNPREPSATAVPARQGRRGHGRATLRDVALAAGVTSITVSRFLREPDRVAPGTAKRIRQALVDTGYVPNKQAGLLASGVSNIVAALLPNLTNSIFAETVQGLSDTLQAAHHELLIGSTGYSLEREEEQLRALLGWHPAAVVVTGRRHSPGATAMLAAARDTGTPVIEIWDCHPSAPGLPTAATAERFTRIGFNHADVGRAMAQHLLDAGHRRLAYVNSGVTEDYRALERGLAFQAHARAAGAHVTVLQAPAGDPFDAGRAMLTPLLVTPSDSAAVDKTATALNDLVHAGTATGAAARPARDAPITAAAFANDHLATGALLEATRRNIAVPQRLALLGFGDFTLARQLVPALSSVALPRYEIGVTAARALLAALQGGGPAASHTLPWSLAARASTA
jgi:LacI family transcriptional regulator, gluconate utilization system Gnt-I transcriptional repressor